MSSTILRLILPLTCAVAALLLRYLLADHPLNSTSQLDFLLLQLPYILLALAALMALLTNHALEAGITISLLCAYWLIQSFLQSPLNSQPASQIFYLLTLLSPALLITYALLPQSSCLQLQGLLAILLTPSIILVVAGLLAINPQLFLSSASSALKNGLIGTYLSTLSWWLLYFAAIGLCLSLSLYQQQSIHNSVLGCSLMTLITYGWIQLNSVSAFMFSGMGLLLCINLTISLLQIGYRDDLTQIGNRRALQQTAKTLRGPYSVAMVDADYFKKINDQFGHDLGDQALRVIASLLKQTAEGGKPFRYGGEEFCLLFKGKTEQEVLDTLEACRQAIANYDMVVRDKQQRPKKLKQGEVRRGASKRKSNFRLTVSIGVASSDNANSNSINPFEQVLKSADKALYRAKASGRNCIQAA